MIIELRNAIESLENSITGSNIYYNHLPEGYQDDTYVTFFIVNNKKFGADTATLYTTAKVQFNIFSRSKLDNGDACFVLVEQVKSLINKEDLVISGSSIAVILTDFEIPPRIVENAFQGTIQYSINIKN